MMRNFKLKEEYELIIGFVGLLLLVLYFSSCNPVKKVLTDPYKFSVVKDSVIKKGYCKCDTSFLYITDTITTVDTLVEVYVDTINIKDTTIFWETKFNTITKVRTIRDSVKIVLTDSTRVKLLSKELNDAKTMEKLALSEMKSLRKMLYLIGGGALAFFLILFKLK